MYTAGVLDIAIMARQMCNQTIFRAVEIKRTCRLVSTNEKLCFVSYFCLKHIFWAVFKCASSVWFMF